MLDARWALIQLNAWPGLDVGALFDDKGLVLGGAKSHLPDKSGSAELLAAGLLEPGHDVARGEGGNELNLGFAHPPNGGRVALQQ